MRQQVRKLEGLIDESMQKCRSLSHELSPPVLHENGLSAALSWLAGDMREKTRLSGETRPRARRRSGYAGAGVAAVSVRQGASFQCRQTLGRRFGRRGRAPRRQLDLHPGVGHRPGMRSRPVAGQRRQHEHQPRRCLRLLPSSRRLSPASLPRRAAHSSIRACAKACGRLPRISRWTTSSQKKKTPSDDWASQVKRVSVFFIATNRPGPL